MAVRLVVELPDQVAALPAAGAGATDRRGQRWSASMYVWHLVDVLRIGVERLTTLRVDPAAGIPCWDENALAEVRRYEWLSPAVGVAVLGLAATEWAEAAAATPAALVAHPLFGQLHTADVLRRNGHEAHHHLLDIRRCLGWADPDNVPAATD